MRFFRPGSQYLRPVFVQDGLCDSGGRNLSILMTSFVIDTFKIRLYFRRKRGLVEGHRRRRAAAYEKEDLTMNTQSVRYRAQTSQTPSGPAYGVEAVAQSDGEEAVLHTYEDVFDSPQEAAAFAALLNQNCVELCHLIDLLEDHLG